MVVRAYKADFKNFVGILVASKYPTYNGTNRRRKSCHTYALFSLFSFIVKSSDGKIHAYILRTVELAEGTMATHTLKMPVDNVHDITAKLELLEPQMN